MTKTQPSLTDQISDERRRVDFDSYDISVQQLLLMLAKNQIDVAPTYQRRFRWDARRQSHLIESIFLGIPVPNLFMATNSDATWEVVDGVQRLSTIAHFAGDSATLKLLNLTESLRIEGLSKLTAMNGLRFLDLPLSIQTQFLLRPAKVTTLSDKSDLKVRFDLFERLNTGGVKLTDQEIRGCIYRGRFNDFLEKMATSADFRKVVVLQKSKEDDGTREEYVLRFFAFLNSYKTFDHSVAGFLNDYMAASTKSFDFARNEKIFNRTFAELAKLFPQGISRRKKLTPVNLYEAIAVGAGLALQKRSNVVTKGLSGWIADRRLRSMTTGATNSQKMVAGRIEYAMVKFGG
jgi:hypothetical protein